jgi:RNA polymerase sigma-70 factor (ECF subfamily)
MTSIPSPNGAARTPADTELMLRIAGGDEAALSELIDRHAATLLGLATRVLRDPADAEEVLQEVFVHAWDRAERYDPQRSSVVTWLVLIARSRAIDRLRSRRVDERTTETVRRQAGGVHESPRAARAVLTGERRTRVVAAMRELPAEQREVLEMAYYRGMTQSEISLATGIPLGTVKTRTLLAMKKLRAALRAEIHELL